MRAAAELGIRTVAVFSEDDAHRCTRARPMRRERCAAAVHAAYLDAEQILAVAKAAGLRRDPSRLRLSQRERGLRAALRRRGNHVRRAAAGDPRSCSATRCRRARWLNACGVPVLPGTAGPTSLDEAKEFLAALGPGGAMMIKAVAGGGGRGMRAVSRVEEVEEAFARCQSEARGVRQRRRLRRAADAARPPYRGADRRRRLGRRQPSVGARMQDPAAQPEARRDRAESRACRPRCAIG